MTQEREKRDIRSPFERLAERFDKITQGNYRDGREISLIDKTKILIIKSRPFPGSNLIEHYAVTIDPFGLPGSDVRNPDNQSFTFAVDEEGLLWGRIPDLVVKIGNVELASHGRLSDLDATEASTQEKTVLAETLVNWVDSLIKENQYSKPPISASIFR